MKCEYLHTWVLAADLDAHPNHLDAIFPAKRTTMRPRRWPWILVNDMLFLLIVPLDCPQLSKPSRTPWPLQPQSWPLTLSNCFSAQRACLVCWNIFWINLHWWHCETKVSMLSCCGNLNRIMSTNKGGRWVYIFFGREVVVVDGEARTEDQ